MRPCFVDYQLQGQRSCVSHASDQTDYSVFSGRFFRNRFAFFLQKADYQRTASFYFMKNAKFPPFSGARKMQNTAIFGCQKYQCKTLANSSELHKIKTVTIIQANVHPMIRGSHKVRARGTNGRKRTNEISKFPFHEIKFKKRKRRDESHRRNSWKRKRLIDYGLKTMQMYFDFFNRSDFLSKKPFFFQKMDAFQRPFRDEQLLKNLFYFKMQNKLLKYGAKKHVRIRDSHTTGLGNILLSNPVFYFRLRSLPVFFRKK